MLVKNLDIENSIKYALLIEYNGNDLVGWQKQNEGMSVQSSLEEAAKNIFNQDFDIQGSGRTDAGVHALGQIAHINLPKGHRLTSRHPFYIISAFNSLLRDTNIRVISAKPVKPEFNAPKDWSGCCRRRPWLDPNRIAPSCTSPHRHRDRTRWPSTRRGLKREWSAHPHQRSPRECHCLWPFSRRTCCHSHSP